MHQPNENFAPQVGIAWDPWKNGKTAIRAGFGIYYENTVWNNVLFDRPGRLEKGLFLGFAQVCPNASLTIPPSTTPTPVAGICGQPVGNVYQQIAALQTTYQGAVLAAGPATNGSYVGNTLTDNQSNSILLFAPNFRTPYSVQINAGIQRELHHGTVLTVDYIRNRGLHYLVYYDTNHVGDARYLNTAAALSAINATNKAFGCPAGSSGIDCAIAAGATISSYAGNGLDSGAAVNGGFPGCNCAFPGINPNVGQNYMLQPIGKSIYNGMDVSLKQELTNPLPKVKRANLQFSYSLSRFNSMSFGLYSGICG